MSSSRTPSQPAPASGGAGSSSRRGVLIAGVIAALVVVALIVAIVASGGDDDEAQGSPSASTVAGGGAAPAEQQPVTVDGPALPERPDGADTAIGMTPPTLNGYSFDGSPLEIVPGGTDKMVVFLAHWCPHCNREVPVLLEWQKAGRMPEGLEVIGVATASDESAPNYPPSEWLEDFGWTWPTLADSPDNEAAQAYGVNGFPFFVIVGADGTVKGRFSGEKSLDDLDAAVRDALATPT